MDVSDFFFPVRGRGKGGGIREGGRSGGRFLLKLEGGGCIQGGGAGGGGGGLGGGTGAERMSAGRRGDGKTYFREGEIATRKVDSELSVEV